MSRIANLPISIPGGISVSREGAVLRVKGGKGELEHRINPNVNVDIGEQVIKVQPNGTNTQSHALAGTTRSLISNMVLGISQGFEKKLSLVGVGYRAQVKGKNLDLTLGFSHPVEYSIPDGITIETPSPTEIVVRGIDKQKVGQVAANIRAYRPPEPYKGKGVRYSDEHVARKEAKKK